MRTIKALVVTTAFVLGAGATLAQQVDKGVGANGLPPEPDTAQVKTGEILDQVKADPAGALSTGGAAGDSTVIRTILSPVGMIVAPLDKALEPLDRATAPVTAALAPVVGPAPVLPLPQLLPRPAPAAVAAATDQPAASKKIVHRKSKKRHPVVATN